VFIHKTISKQKHVIL
jgi:hypothetical protein